MRKFFGLILFLTNLNFCLAQQRPHYSQYLQNMSVINPAVTGINNGIDFRMGLRNQWLGVADAPRTSYLSLSTPVFLGNDMSKYGLSDLGVVDPATHDDAIGYLSSPSHHSLGLLVLNDKTGPISRLVSNFNYAYHIQISDMFNLSAGFGVGINRTTLNASVLRFEESDDPVVGMSDKYNKVLPDLNIGVYFYSANFYVGASMQQIVPNELQFSDMNSLGKEVAHYFVTSGFKIWISEEIGILPSVMVKKVAPLPMAFDLNLKATYQNRFWIGGSFRKGDAISAMFGFKVLDKVTLGYAYDYTISDIKQISSGSHELTFGLKF